MKRGILKGIFAAVFFILYLAGMGVLLHLARERRHGVACGGMEVGIVGGHALISEDEVRAAVDAFYGTYIGQRIGDVDIASIENMLSLKSMVRRSEVWTTDDGTLHVQVFEREPVMRFEHRGNTCYVDAEGVIFPVGENPDSLGVPLMRCDPVLGTDSGWLASATGLLKRMESVRPWKGRVCAYEIRDGESDLIVEMDGGELKIVYGDFSDADRKDRAMREYYSKIAPTRTGEKKKYRTVNLKYKGQIVCRTTDL